MMSPIPRRNSAGSTAATSLPCTRTRLDLVAADYTPVFCAQAALALARHGRVGEAELVGIYDPSSATVQPVVAAAVALLQPSAAVRGAVTGDSALNRGS